jgi:hypothetical protein
MEDRVETLRRRIAVYRRCARGRRGNARGRIPEIADAELELAELIGEHRDQG